MPNQAQAFFMVVPSVACLKTVHCIAPFPFPKWLFQFSGLHCKKELFLNGLPVKKKQKKW